MKLIFRKGLPLSASRAASLVAAAAARLDMSKEEALAIAKAEPRGATVFAGAIKHTRKPIQVRLIRTRLGNAHKQSKGPVTAG